MPNTDYHLWVLFAAVALLIISLIWYFLHANFKLRLSQSLERENSLKNEFETYSFSSENKLIELYKNFENSVIEKNQLENQISALHSDYKNATERIEDFRIENSSLNRKLDDTRNLKNQLDIEMTKISSDNAQLKNELTNERQKLNELNLSLIHI